MMIEKEIQRKKKRISVIKNKISELGELRTGSLSQQWNVCGTPNCQCKDSKKPKKHGPYYPLSYMRYKKSHTEFISKEHIVNYKTFMKLKDEWIDLSIEISKLKKEMNKKGKKFHDRKNDKRSL